MKCIIVSVSLALISLLIPESLFSQTAVDSLQRLHARFYQKSLRMDSTRAREAASVQVLYKQTIYKIEADSTLTLEEKRKRMKAAMKEKNKKLSGFLNQEQYNKIVPGTERSEEENTDIKK